MIISYKVPIGVEPSLRRHDLEILADFPFFPPANVQRISRCCVMPCKCPNENHMASRTAQVTAGQRQVRNVGVKAGGNVAIGQRVTSLQVRLMMTVTFPFSVRRPHRVIIPTDAALLTLACSSAHLQLNAFWLSASNAAFTYDPSALRRWSGLTETPPAKIHPTTALRDGSALTQRHRQPVSPPHHRYRSASMIPTQVKDRSRCHAGLRVQSP
jgi:hypothetical protein